MAPIWEIVKFASRLFHHFCISRFFKNHGICLLYSIQLLCIAFFQKSSYKYEQLKLMNRNHHRKYWGKKIISRVYKKRSTEFDSDFSYFFIFWIFKFAYIGALDEIRVGSYSDYSKISAHFRTDGSLCMQIRCLSSRLSFKFIDFNESMNTIPYDIWEVVMSSSPIRKDLYSLCYSP